jgi:hypothetical protein
MSVMTNITNMEYEIQSILSQIWHVAKHIQFLHILYNSLPRLMTIIFVDARLGYLANNTKLINMWNIPSSMNLKWQCKMLEFILACTFVGIEVKANIHYSNIIYHSHYCKVWVSRCTCGWNTIWYKFWIEHFQKCWWRWRGNFFCTNKLLEAQFMEC